jgi:hypothetical protein
MISWIEGMVDSVGWVESCDRMGKRFEGTLEKVMAGGRRRERWIRVCRRRRSC